MCPGKCSSRLLCTPAQAFRTFSLANGASPAPPSPPRPELRDENSLVEAAAARIYQAAVEESRTSAQPLLEIVRTHIGRVVASGDSALGFVQQHHPYYSNFAQWFRERGIEL